MTSPLTCPNCGREARFTEVYPYGEQMYLRCELCHRPTDDAELAAAQPPETCTEAMIRIEQENPVAYVEFNWYDMPRTESFCTDWFSDWIFATFIHRDRIQITRMEVHV